MSNATGTQSDARFETSAAQAEVEASTVKLANQVEVNAEQIHDVAGEAARKAQHTAPARAVNQLEQGLSEKTDAAAAEGQSSVQGYVEQAKNLATSVLTTAQSYLPGSLTGTQPQPGSIETTNTEGAPPSSIDTAKEYLAQAQEAATPYAKSALAAGVQAAQTAKTTAVPYIQGAADSLSRSIAGASAQHSGSTELETQHDNVPPTQAAHLESGQHILDTPYPATSTGQSSKVAQL